MVILTCVGGFGSFDLHCTLFEKVYPMFTDSDWAHARIFFKRNKVARHECMIRCPGWATIGYPVENVFNTNMKYFSVLLKF